MSSATTPLIIRPPPALTPSSVSSSSFTKPSTDFLSGTWHVTHSTLPMWKSNRNVRITYTPLTSKSAEAGSIDDLVEYQPLNSDKWKTINGIDRLDTTDPHNATYNWRGKGWLKIASSRWSVVGWGEDEGGWAVTFFEKTLFTPAGVDIYARRKAGLSEDLVQRIREGMKRVTAEGKDSAGEFTKHADGLFDIKHDSG